jgi:hypothetical protein
LKKRKKENDRKISHSSQNADSKDLTSPSLSLSNQLLHMGITSTQQSPSPALKTPLAAKSPHIPSNSLTDNYLDSTMSFSPIRNNFRSPKEVSVSKELNLSLLTPISPLSTLQTPSKALYSALYRRKEHIGKSSSAYDAAINRRQLMKAKPADMHSISANEKFQRSNNLVTSPLPTESTPVKSAIKSIQNSELDSKGFKQEDFDIDEEMYQSARDVLVEQVL